MPSYAAERGYRSSLPRSVELGGRRLPFAGAARRAAQGCLPRVAGCASHHFCQCSPQWRIASGRSRRVLTQQSRAGVVAAELRAAPRATARSRCACRPRTRRPGPGHVHGLLQLAREVVANGGEMRRGRRAPRSSIRAARRNRARGVSAAKRGIVTWRMRVVRGVLRFVVRVERVAHGPFHVRLPRAQPHVAHQHVVHAFCRRVRRARGERVRPAGRNAGIVTRPAARGVRASRAWSRRTASR